MASWVGDSSSGDFFDMLIGCNRTLQIIKECFNNKQWKRVFSILARGIQSILLNESMRGRRGRNVLLVEFILTEGTSAVKCQSSLDEGINEFLANKLHLYHFYDQHAQTLKF